MSQDNEDSRRKVQEELEALKGFASTTSVDSLRSGGWFSELLKHALETYTREVNAEFFQRKYPNLPFDAVADRRIELAQRYTMIEAGATASAYTGLVAATIGSKGGASPWTLPGAATTFTLDLLYVTRLQLRLAYDLAVLYGHPIDINDPEDLYDLLRVAFGVKAGEAFRAAVPRLAPEAAREAVKSFIKGSVLTFLQGLPVVGQYLLQRNIIKFAVPAVGIPVSMGLNHYQTGRVGKQARAIYRDKAAIIEVADAMIADLETYPSLLLRAIWLVVYVDRKIEAEESWLLKALVNRLSQNSEAEPALKEFARIVELDRDEFYRDLSMLPPDLQKELFAAASKAAIVDHDLGSAEVAVLRELAGRCGVAFDLAALKAQAKQAAKS